MRSWSVADTSAEILARTLEMSGIPHTSRRTFWPNPEEWLGRARLTSARQITYLPARQVNLVNWSGGVGKTTLAMAICKRFVERTGLPAALLELSMGGSALHARICQDLPEFFAIATHKEEAGAVVWRQPVPDGWAHDRGVVERRSGWRAAGAGRDPPQTHPVRGGLLSGASAIPRTLPIRCQGWSTWW